jgi:hypothetical protein
MVVSEKELKWMTLTFPPPPPSPSTPPLPLYFNECSLCTLYVGRAFQYRLLIICNYVLTV